jgi:hypothetical protein
MQIMIIKTSMKGPMSTMVEISNWIKNAHFGKIRSQYKLYSQRVMTAIEAASIKYFCLYSEASFDIDK